MSHVKYSLHSGFGPALRPGPGRGAAEELQGRLQASGQAAERHHTE